MTSNTNDTLTVKVTFDGFLQKVEREFLTIEDAEHWLRKIGKWENPHHPVKIETIQSK